MKGENLGEFEELVLLTVASLNNEAYAVAVKQELQDRAKRVANISAIHSSLYRLEDKGFLTSEFGGATNKRGGEKEALFQSNECRLCCLTGDQKLKGKNFGKRFLV